MNAEPSPKGGMIIAAVPQGETIKIVVQNGQEKLETFSMPNDCTVEEGLFQFLQARRGDDLRAAGLVVNLHGALSKKPRTEVLL